MNSPSPFQMRAAVPVLATIDIARSVQFFADTLGFTTIFADDDSAGISRDGVELHLWSCGERAIAEATSCRIMVEGIDALYAVCARAGVVHPNGPLERKPWGSREFAIVDPQGSLVTFVEPGE